jgi:Asp-tRNA(Asn)/Glu-tRNA(Gln) amidotransferase A subunit family amidase
MLLNTNRTGHPQLSVPMGVSDRGAPIGFSVFGRLYDETTPCQIGWAVQQETGTYRLRPDLSGV